MKRNEFLQSVIPRTGNAKPANRFAAESPTGSLSMRRATSGLEPYSGAWNTTTAGHLLRRTMFGPRRGEIQALAAGSMTAAVNTILGAQTDPSPPTATIGATTYDFTNNAYDTTNDGTFRNYLKAWWLALMVKQNISIIEKMTLFWHNHFVSELNDIQDSRYSYYQNKLFRQYALGNFRNLTRAVAIDPAMLRYLNGNQNIKGRPNENFARELQELFTIGKGPEKAQGDYTNYSEQDVQAAARVLTGWRDSRTTVLPSAEFILANHDTSNKVFSADYQGRTIVGGTTLADGNRELDELLDMIFSQTATSLYICRKLYRWFVYYDIPADVEANVIAPMATILRNNNFEVKPVLDTLLKSAHFYDPINMGCFIRTPIDIVVGPVRQMSSTIPDLTNLTTTNYNIANGLRDRASTLGMNLFDPPDVAGWKAYYQVPDFHELWINSTTLPTRGSYTDGLVTGKDAQNRTSPVKIDSIAYVQMMSSPGDAFKLVDDLAGEISGLALTQKQKDYLLQNVMGLPPGAEYNWTDAWNLYVQNPNNTTAKNAVTAILNSLLKFMLRMAEAQLA